MSGVPTTMTLWRRLVSRLRADSESVRRRVVGQGDRRGIVLIMTLLMMTMLTLLGSAAVMQTANDIHETGAHRVERAVFRIAEAATMGAVGMAGTMGGRFDDFSQNKSNRLTEADFGGGLMNLEANSTSSFGRELMSLGASGFTVTISEPTLSTAVAGYESGKYCFHSYTLTTLGHVGDTKSANPRERALAGQAGMSAQVVVGPVQCNN